MSLGCYRCSKAQGWVLTAGPTHRSPTRACPSLLTPAEQPQDTVETSLRSMSDTSCTCRIRPWTLCDRNSWRDEACREEFPVAGTNKGHPCRSQHHVPLGGHRRHRCVLAKQWEQRRGNEGAQEGGAQEEVLQHQRPQSASALPYRNWPRR